MMNANKVKKDWFSKKLQNYTKDLSSSIQYFNQYQGACSLKIDSKLQYIDLEAKNWSNLMKIILRLNPEKNFNTKDRKFPGINPKYASKSKISLFKFRHFSVIYAESHCIKRESLVEFVYDMICLPVKKYSYRTMLSYGTT